MHGALALTKNLLNPSNMCENAKLATKNLDITYVLLKGLQVLMHLEEMASELLKAQFCDIRSQVQQLNHKCTRIWFNPNYNLITSIFNLKTSKN